MLIQIIWDPEDDPDGNVCHIREGGVTEEEVDEIVSDPESWLTLERSRSSGYPILFGETGTGRRLAVVFQFIDEDPPLIYPITAYEPRET